MFVVLVLRMFCCCGYLVGNLVWFDYVRLYRFWVCDSLRIGLAYCFSYDVVLVRWLLCLCDCGYVYFTTGCCFAVGCISISGWCLFGLFRRFVCLFWIWVFYCLVVIWLWVLS